MLLKQQFKTLAGAQKRCAFENAHGRGKYRYTIVRCQGGEEDRRPLSRDRMDIVRWRLRREVIVPCSS